RRRVPAAQCLLHERSGRLAPLRRARLLSARPPTVARPTLGGLSAPARLRRPRPLPRRARRLRREAMVSLRERRAERPRRLRDRSGELARRSGSERSSLSHSREPLRGGVTDRATPRGGVRCSRAPSRERPGRPQGRPPGRPQRTERPPAGTERPSGVVVVAAGRQNPGRQPRDGAPVDPADPRLAHAEIASDVLEPVLLEVEASY